MQERLSPCRDAAQVSVEVEMSAESNKTIVGRLYEEVANNGKLDLLDELAVPDFEEHSPLPGQPGGIEGLKFRIASILTGFHPKYTLHRVIASSRHRGGRHGSCVLDDDGDAPGRRNGHSSDGPHGHLLRHRHPSP